MTGFLRRIPAWFGIVAYVLVDVLLSSVRIAWDVLTPTMRARPGVLRVPLDLESDFQISLMANLVTVSPGSLTLDVAEDRSALYVHVMFLDDPDRMRRELKDGLESRVREATE